MACLTSKFNEVLGRSKGRPFFCLENPRRSSAFQSFSSSTKPISRPVLEIANIR